MSALNLVGLIGVVVVIYGLVVIAPWRVGMGSFWYCNAILLASLAITAVVGVCVFAMTA